MFKKKHFSAHGDFRTGFLYKFSLAVGLLLLCIFIFLKVSSFQSSSAGSIIAFSILFLSIGAILYFFHQQFSKLAKIANEIENEAEDKDSK